MRDSGVKQRLHEIFMQAPAAMAVLEGPTHVFTVANPRYMELVGRHDVIGKAAQEVLPDLAGERIERVLDDVLRTGEPFASLETKFDVDRDGDGVPEEHFVDFVYQPVRDAAGTVTGIMAHVVDVTQQVTARREIEQKAAELARLTEDLAQSNRELDQFAYVASHDLKAPLRGIANLSQWIEEDVGEQLSGESREHMRLLRGRVHRMEALIDGILTYSRAGRMRAALQQVDTGALIREVIDLLDVPAGVTIDVQPGMPVIEAERVPMQQVLMNLIGNAVKYGRAVRDDVVVRVGWREAGDAWEFTVADNGPGIPPEFQERIWGIFQTLQPRDKVEGTGIGLSVVRKVVESRGGRTWVESDGASGATFHVLWPRTSRSVAHSPEYTP